LIRFVLMLTPATVNPLDSIPCFARLDPGTSKKVQQSLQLQAFSKGEVIILEGERCPGLYVVKSGSVKLYRSSPEGGEHIVRLINRSACFECAPLFDHGPNPTSAQALEDSELYLLPASDFRALLVSDSTMALRFSEVLAMRLRALLNTIEDMSFRPAHARLARLLLQMAEPRGDVLAVAPKQPLNQQHLACMLGCSRQVVNTSLNKLVRQGIIRKEGRSIIVLKPENLKELINTD